MAAALEIVPRQRSGVGSATVNAARQTGTVLGIAVLGMILANHVESATPPAFADAFVDGLQPSLLTAGLIVLAAAALLVALPATRRKPAATSPPDLGARAGAREKPVRNAPGDAQTTTTPHRL
jgi:DHA2 family methylenomycin A resistance protein-like MFS transporter